MMIWREEYALHIRDACFRAAGKYCRAGSTAAVPTQVQSISPGEYPLRAYAFPFLHSSIRRSASSCATALKLTSRPINRETYKPLWARACAPRNNSQTPKAGSLPRWYGTSNTQVHIGRVLLAITSEHCSCYEGSTS
jgi:hypothetical protein